MAISVWELSPAVMISMESFGSRILRRISAVLNTRVSTNPSLEPRITLFLFRFTDPSCRIGAAVDGKTGVIAVDKETGYAREKLEDHFAAFMDQAYLSIGKVLLGKAVCILWHPVCWMEESAWRSFKSVSSFVKPSIK